MLKQAKGSLMSAVDPHGNHQRSVASIRLDELAPTFQMLGREHQVQSGHITLMRQDRQRMQRVAQAIRSGGWSMTKEEACALDLFGPERMQIAPQVNDIWVNTNPLSRCINYSAETLKRCAYDRAWRLVYINQWDIPNLEFQILNHPGISTSAMKRHTAGTFSFLQQTCPAAITGDVGYLLIRQVWDGFLKPEREKDTPLTFEEQQKALETFDFKCYRMYPYPALEASITNLFAVGYQGEAARLNWTHTGPLFSRGAESRRFFLEIGGPASTVCGGSGKRAEEWFFALQYKQYTEGVPVSPFMIVRSFDK